MASTKFLQYESILIVKIIIRKIYLILLKLVIIP